MKSIIVLIGLLLVIIALAVASDSCLTCHSDAKRMSALGAAALTITGQEVEKQSRMPAGCSDCHLGNPDASERDQAHAGLARLLVVRKKGLTADPTATNPAAAVWYQSDEPPLHRHRKGWKNHQRCIGGGRFLA